MYICIRNDAYWCPTVSPILNNSMHGQNFCHAVSRRANNTTSENTVFMQARYSIYTMLCFKESFIQGSQQQGVEVGIREAVPLKLPSFDFCNALTTSRIALSSCVYCNFVKHTAFSLQSELKLTKNN